MSAAIRWGVANPETPSHPLVAVLRRKWPTGWRSVLLVLLIPVWLIAACGVVARWWDALILVPMIQAIFPIFGLVAVVVLALSLLTRVGWAIIAALAVAAAPIVLAGRTLLSDTVSASGDDETVLTLNIEFGGADPDAVVALVKDRKVDTLVVLELTDEGWEGLRSAGLEKLLPNTVGEPDVSASGSMILSRHPLTEVPGDDYDELHSSFAQPIARVERPSGAYVLRAVHPYPPVLGGTGAWHGQLSHLGEWQRKQPAGEPLVLAGDFNASRSHPVFRTATDGLTDAQSATGAGWVRTWPVGKRIPAFVAIDHIMVRDIGVVDAGDAVVPQTDHRAVWAVLRIG